MKLARLRDGGSVAGADALRQALGFFPEMLEGRIVRQRTRRHSDLLARVSGLVACGPQHQARKRLPVGLDETGGLGPFRGLGASRALESMLADSPLRSFDDPMLTIANEDVVHRFARASVELCRNETVD